MGYKETLASVAASLDQLQVEYIDLVMVHHRAADFGEWPRTASSMKAFPDDWAGAGNPVNDHPGVLNGGKATWQPPPCAVADATWLGCQDGTWKALTELKAQGKLKAIGVSNWMKSNLERMKALGQELPAVNQVGVRPLLHLAQITQEPPSRECTVYTCAGERARACACVRACVRACVCACACACACVYTPGGSIHPRGVYTMFGAVLTAPALM